MLVMHPLLPVLDSPSRQVSNGCGQGSPNDGIVSMVLWHDFEGPELVLGLGKRVLRRRYHWIGIGGCLSDELRAAGNAQSEGNDAPRHNSSSWSKGL